MFGRSGRFAGAILALAWMVMPAAAQTCWVSFTNVDFGDVNVLTGTQQTTSGSMSITCLGTYNQQIIICPSLGAGSGGADATGNTRYMLNGTNQLNYNLYTPTNNVWGSLYWGRPPGPPGFLLPLSTQWWWFGIGRGTASINATLFGGQNTAAVGLYTSQFTTAEVRVDYGYYSTGVDCTNIPNRRTATASFTVQANVVPSCSVSATDLNFGVAGTLNTNIDTVNTITVTCTRGVSYQVGLSGGTSGATNPAARTMTNGTNSITYGIYQDAARTIGWGDQLGVNTLAGTGTGLPQNYTGYGRVFAQPTPPPGTYTDTIVVTVTY